MAVRNELSVHTSMITQMEYKHILYWAEAIHRKFTNHLGYHMHEKLGYERFCILLESTILTAIVIWLHVSDYCHFWNTARWKSLD